MDTANQQAAPEYAPPLDRLLTRGEPDIGDAEEWPDYVQELELGPEHVPDLIRMATDQGLRWPDEEEEDVDEDEDEEAARLLASWAPVHAWRALGQLRAEEAGEPLLALFKHKDDDWVGEEVPQTYGMIGSTAIPALAAYLDNAEHGTSPRISAITALEAIARRDLESYETVVEVLMRRLATTGVEDAELTAFFINALTNLKATQALPLIDQAFAEDRVAAWVIDQTFVQREFGLITPEEAELRWDAARRQRMQALEAVESEYVPEELDEEEPELAPLIPTPGSKPTADKAKAKAKRKMAQQSRKKNKKRK